jgi:hypothetical protein
MPRSGAWEQSTFLISIHPNPKLSLDLGAWKQAIETRREQNMRPPDCDPHMHMNDMTVVTAQRHITLATTKIATYNVASQHSPVKIDQAMFVRDKQKREKKVAGSSLFQARAFQELRPACCSHDDRTKNSGRR